MSNQTAGADEKSCPWCMLWNAAFAASRIDGEYFNGLYRSLAKGLQVAGERLMPWLAKRETDCPHCQRSAEIYRGEVLGHEAAKWRAAMWAQNPSMRFMMRVGPGDTFDEVADG